MNKERLQSLISNYIKGFATFNSPVKGESNETYKWVAVQRFQDHFDINAENFAEMLYQVWRDSDTMIDSARQQPFYALVDYARNKGEAETIRQMFIDLYKPDNDDLKIRQNKIDAFVAKSEQLKNKYYPGSWRYTNDQRTAMAYLFLNNPEHNYLYKSKQAHEFADCVEFYDDWGSSTNFKLPVYYRMCDQLVAEMRNNPALMETNQSRFEAAKEPLYADKELHILAFDIIYASQVYGLYGGISYSHPDTAAKKLYLERVEKAKEYKKIYDEISAQQERLNQMRDLALKSIQVGNHISHKAFGDGVVEDVSEGNITVRFTGAEQPKKFSLLSSILNRFLKLDDSTLYVALFDNADILKNEGSIPSRLKSAEENMLKYQEYLDI